jgi:hypothetical protein
MNIKGLGAVGLPNEVRLVDKVDRVVRSNKSNDRDGNGKQEFQQNNQEQPKPPMTPEQLETCLEHLKKLDAVKEHSWSIELEVLKDQTRFVLVKDNLGNLIRRIPEADLWTLSTDKESRGQIFQKVA